MINSQIQELEKQLLPPIRIFVDNDALAFFDIIKSKSPIDVEKIKQEPIKNLHGQPYVFLVEEAKTNYFRIGGHKSPLYTVSVTTPCIIFCAYTTENGRIKSSGVYHWNASSLEDKLHELIDTITSTHDEQVTVKAAGREKDDQCYRNKITEILVEKNVKIEPSYLLLGGGKYRVTKFYPQSGQLITYLEYKPQHKTII